MKNIIIIITFLLTVGLYGQSPLVALVGSSTASNDLEENDLIHFLTNSTYNAYTPQRVENIGGDITWDLEGTQIQIKTGNEVPIFDLTSYGSNAKITAKSVDLSSLKSLSINGGTVTNINLDIATGIDSLSLVNNLLTTARLDSIVNMLDVNGLSNGYLYLSTNSGSLSSDSYDGYQNLISKGWAIDVSSPADPNPPSSIAQLYNFSINNTTPTRVDFEASSSIIGMTHTGFIIHGKTLSSGNELTIDGDGLGGYFTVSVPFTFWDNTTIRKEGGGTTVNDFTLTHIQNDINEPVSTTFVYVTATAPGGGTGAIGSPWTINEAEANAAAGTTVYIKAGDYTNQEIRPEKVGNSTTGPIKFIGYTTFVGDLDTDYAKTGFDYVDTANANLVLDSGKFPLFTGVNADGGNGVYLNKDYFIFKNIQFTNYLYNFWGNGSDYLYLSNITVANGYQTIAVNTGSGIFIGATRAFNVRVENCLAFDNSAQNLYCRGENHLFIGNSSWGGNNTGNAPVDYYLSTYDGSYNIHKNNYIERVTDLSHGGHGIGFKTSNTDNAYNLVVGNDVRGLRGEIYYAAHRGTHDNVWKENYTYGYAGDAAVLVARNGAYDNIFENNTGENCKYSIYMWANLEDIPTAIISAASGNIFRNNIFIDIGSGVTHSNQQLFHHTIDNNKIYNNTFVNTKTTSNAFFWDSSAADATSSLNFNGNEFKNNLVVDIDFALYDGNIDADYLKEYNNWYNCIFTTPSGTGNFDVNPILDVNYKPTATFTTIDVPTLPLVELDKNLLERNATLTTVGAVLHANETP